MAQLFVRQRVALRRQILRHWWIFPPGLNLRAASDYRHEGCFFRGRTMTAKTAEAVRPIFDISVPDALLPEQYFSRLSASTSDTPERRLLFAVLLDAVILLQRRNTSGSAEAERWIRNEADADSPFSFRNVCEALGIEPKYLQRGLLSWRRSQPGALPGIPVRQLRTSHRRVTPLGRRRRRRATL